MMRALLRDIGYGVRVFRNSPGFTAATVLTLALGIAANTTVFGWIDTLLVNPIPGATRGDRLVSIETILPTGEFSTTSWRDYLDYRDTLTLISGAGASLLNPFALGDENPQRLSGEYVSANYFEVLGVRPVLGRAFLASECVDQAGACPVAVISHRLWQQRFHGDRTVLGRTVRVNRHPLTVIGVAPPQFRGTLPGFILDIWVPMVMAPALNGQGEWLLTDRREHQMWITARLKPGVTVTQANAEVDACARRIATISPATNTGVTARLTPVWKAHIGLQGYLLTPLRILMAVCGVVFLIVAANVTNLQLVSATARRKEFSVRLALGAARGRLVRQLLTESLLLAGAGAGIGIGLAAWLGGSMQWMLPVTEFPIDLDFRLNPEILAFAITLCCALALMTGLAPAWQSTGVDLNESLKENGRSGTSGTGLQRLRGMMVISEVALAMVALVGMGLFTRSFLNARSMSPGMDSHNLLFAQYHVDTFCKTKEQREQFCIRLRDRLVARPGIAAAGYSLYIPLAFSNSAWAEVQVEGYTPRRKEDARAFDAQVSPGYFDALGIPILNGRDFTEQDTPQTAPVAIVNQTFAQKFLGGRDPVGSRARNFNGGPWVTIVGLVKDSKYRSVTEPATPYFYLPYRQSHGGEFWTAFFIRTTGPSRDQIGAVRREASLVEPSAAAFPVIPFEEHISASLFPQRVAAALLSVLGAIALILAALGLYGVLAFAVGQREQEFGIRMALGAQAGDVLSAVIRQGALLALAGVAVGAILALAVARVTGDLLVNLSPSDPWIIGGASLFLLVIALIASYLPARQATKVDPFSALQRHR
ncbi:MAG TPA: ABC transporter permease [Bryobacteraceae bacterium]|nr:ABC transporter permease [Bryobacteraceae bacterium]